MYIDYLLMQFFLNIGHMPMLCLQPVSVARKCPKKSAIAGVSITFHVNSDFLSVQ